MADVEQGYLVLADVSGYTGFLAGIELEHANGILGDLVQQMLDGLAPPFELAAIEGDAVFVYGPAGALSRGETLLEVIESTYHCHHGKSVVDHTIVDWIPFSSFSEEVRPRAGIRALLTWRLDPADGGTRLRLDAGMSAPLPHPVRRRFCRRFAERELRGDLAGLEQAIVGEAAA